MKGLTLTADAPYVLRKASTWCGWTAAGCVGALGFYAMAPDRAQNLVPDLVLTIVMVLGMGCGFAVAVATSIQQKSIPKS